MKKGSVQETAPSDPVTEEDEKLMKQWEDQMADFIPEKMLSMDLAGKTDEVWANMLGIKFIGILPRCD